MQPAEPSSTAVHRSSPGLEAQRGAAAEQITRSPSATPWPGLSPAGRVAQVAPLSGTPRPQITKAVLYPGCVGVKREPRPSRPNRAHLRNLQSRAHNGLSDEENLGDRGNFHAVMWVRNPRNPGQETLRGPGEPECVEARAGYDLAQPICRLQGSDLPETEPGEVWEFWGPTDLDEGDWDAQVMLCWASEGNVEYSRKELSLATKGGGRDFGAAAWFRAAAYAEGAFEPDPAWARNPSNMAPQFRAGAVCTTAVVKAKQASAIRRMEARQAEDQGVADARLSNAQRLGGLAAWDAESLSPRTLEHLLRTAKHPDGRPQYKYLGQLVVCKRRVPEGPFPHPAKQLPPLPPDDPRTVEYEARASARASKL